jgi:alkylated DNA nucleotide flippase Atl1
LKERPAHDRISASAPLVAPPVGWRGAGRDWGAPMYRKRGFREKLADSKDFPRVQPLSGGMKRWWGPGTIVLPAPWEVDALMRRVPKGKVITINQLREVLARRHRATVACPIVTGIHARTAAGAAGEDEVAGRRRVTPYWRTLKVGGEVNARYPGGLAGQRRRLEAEGLTVVARGTRLFVRDHERFLAALR